MVNDIYTQLIESGRISSALGEQRRRRESGSYRQGLKTGASRGFLAGRVSNYAGLIRGTLRLSGLWARGKRNARAIEINENRIVLPNLAKEFEGFKLLHLSDLHLDLAHDLGEVIAAAIEDLSYDVCIITGDFRAQTNGPWEPCIKAFERVQKNLTAPTFAVLGNHDCLEIAHQLEQREVTLLMNEHRMLIRGTEQLALIGIDDPHYFETDDIEAASEGVPEKTMKILLSHTPEPYLAALALNIDCLFAGHTHGGQICLPGGIPVIVNADCPRQYCRGAWQHQTLKGFTSSGTGSSVIDVRFNCPPEAVIHELVSG